MSVSTVTVAPTGGAADSGDTAIGGSPPDTPVVDYSSYIVERKVPVATLLNDGLTGPGLYDFPKLNESYLDDEIYIKDKKPYRHITEWFLAKKGTPNLRLPLPKNLVGSMKRMILYGELEPNQSDTIGGVSIEERLKVRLEGLLHCTIDTSHTERGVWVETKAAWYKLKKPSSTQSIQPDGKSVSQEELHIPIRAKFGLVSNMLDMLGEECPVKPMAKVHRKHNPKECYDRLSLPSDDPLIMDFPGLNQDPFDYDILRREVKFVRFWLSAGFPMYLDKQCAFIRGLDAMERDLNRAKRNKEEWTQEVLDLEACALWAEARSQRMPWGDMKPEVFTPTINELETIRRRRRDAEVMHFKGSHDTSLCCENDGKSDTSKDGPGSKADCENGKGVLVPADTPTPTIVDANLELDTIRESPKVDTSSPTRRERICGGREERPKEFSMSLRSTKKRGLKNGQSETDKLRRSQKKRVTFAFDVEALSNRNATQTGAEAKSRTGKKNEVGNGNLHGTHERSHAGRVVLHKKCCFSTKDGSETEYGEESLRSKNHLSASESTIRKYSPLRSINIIHEPREADFLSTHWLLEERDALEKYFIRQSLKGKDVISEDMHHDFLNNIVCAETVDNYYTMYVAVNALRNSSQVVIQSLFSVESNGTKESGCRAIFVTWLQEVMRRMKNRRRSPAGRAGLRERHLAKMKHTEEEIAISIVQLLQVCCGPRGLGRLCPRHAKRWSGVDFTRIVDGLQKFSESQDVVPLTTACEPANILLRKIRDQERGALTASAGVATKKAKQSTKRKILHCLIPPALPAVHQTEDVLGDALEAKRSYSTNKLIRDCDQIKIRRQETRAERTAKMDLIDQVRRLTEENAILRGRGKKCASKCTKSRQIGKTARVLNDEYSDEGVFGLTEKRMDKTSRQQHGGDSARVLAGTASHPPSPSPKLHGAGKNGEKPLGEDRCIGAHTHPINNMQEVQVSVWGTPTAPRTVQQDAHAASPSEGGRYKDGSSNAALVSPSGDEESSFLRMDSSTGGENDNFSKVSVPKPPLHNSEDARGTTKVAVSTALGWSSRLQEQRKPLGQISCQSDRLSGSVRPSRDCSGWGQSLTQNSSHNRKYPTDSPDGGDEPLPSGQNESTPRIQEGKGKASNLIQRRDGISSYASQSREKSEMGSDTLQLVHGESSTDSSCRSRQPQAQNTSSVNDQGAINGAPGSDPFGDVSRSGAGKPDESIQSSLDSDLEEGEIQDSELTFYTSNESTTFPRLEANTSDQDCQDGVNAVICEQQSWLV
uniref:Uncharacterized protein n=1 Tax=Odontella aurita TaxID=265563 RepID=A0A7S4JJX7_9STRA|mmetsp:Transcript_47686/g.144181  ORF Transcript_47686/g.144181 Transcript_47686/m.144181 type:complete len:1278 (+) Transcript_47686:639-4472(+)|eukprot:CAMPEP_0113561202 /NCGR_PEP_ID=MMETSP0015_2-20120614/19852_1 /TAXON_ID=2838 /ORGANISM="Odontella" /LENGTH=1277 /DNA_ID=CAMNT_0000462985 /DNA_START=503 /DNA_END=4336 /DNA_ORIENTATION=+ /assembly_acc=CAM_ASM_000160